MKRMILSIFNRPVVAFYAAALVVFSKIVLDANHAWAILTSSDAVRVDSVGGMLAQQQLTSLMNPLWAESITFGLVLGVRVAWVLWQPARASTSANKVAVA